MYNYQKKKGANVERKQLKQQTEEAQRFQELKDQLAATRQEHILWQLFHIEKETKDHRKEKTAKETLLAELKNKQTLVDAELKKAKQDQAKLHKESLITEKKIRKQAEQDGRAEEIKAKEEIQFLTKKTSAANSSLNKINEEYEKQQRNIKSLQQEIKDLQKQAKELEAEAAKQRKEKTITLERDQITEYNIRYATGSVFLTHYRKEEAYSATAAEQQQLQQYNRLLKHDTDAMNNCENKIRELESRKKQVEETIEKLKERKSKIHDIMVDNNAKLDTLKKRLQEVSAQSEHDRYSLIISSFLLPGSDKQN